jgi:hypothetical protein
VDLIGRQAERAELTRWAEDKRPHLVAVFGRRRVGKTWLVRNHFGNRFTFALTGVANAPKSEQLAAFNDAAAEFGGGRHGAASNWREAFLVLRRIIEDDLHPGKKIVFLDELPWLATDKSGFLEALGHFWNSWAMMREDLLLIVCGSATSWMSDKLIDNVGGLHGRITGSLYLKPFTLAESEEFLSRSGVVLTRAQILEAAMVFGGIPYYLSLIQPRQSVAQAVDAICFADGAPLRHEFPNLYRSLFKNSAAHIDVVEALAGKAKGLTRQEILAATGLTNGGGLSKTLTDLTVSGFVRQYRAFGKTRRDALYQLVDPFSLFALRFMGEGQVDQRFWSGLTSTPRQTSWTGYAFETQCLLHLEQLRGALGISGVQTEVASWSGRSDAGQAQIDLVLDRADRVINLCEMKYASDPLAVDAALDRAVRRRRAIFTAATGTRKTVHLTLVTTYPVEPTPHADVFQSIVTMDDLFEPA